MTLKSKTQIKTLRARLENSAKAQSALRAAGKHNIADQFAAADEAFANRLAALKAARTELKTTKTERVFLKII